MIFDYCNYVKENATSGLVNYINVSTGTALFDHKSVCPFCKKIIKNMVYYKKKNDCPEWLAGTFVQYETVIQCPTCGWWEYKYSNYSDAITDGIRASDVEYCSAILRQYDESSVSVPLDALREQLLKTPDIIYNLNPYKMEDLVRSVFSDFYPGCKVFSFGRTRDGGRDGMIIDENGRQILIQVKRRTRVDHTEGVGVLREMMGAAILEDNLRGCIFVSTADHFSRDSKEYAENIVDKNIVEMFDLYDCKKFLKMVDITKDSITKEWNKMLRL